jgi:hypothetical protein
MRPANINAFSRKHDPQSEDEISYYYTNYEPHMIEWIAYKKESCPVFGSPRKVRHSENPRHDEDVAPMALCALAAYSFWQ